MNRLTIPIRLPTFNEYSDAERTHRQKAAKLKKEAEDAIGYCIISAKYKKQLRPPKKPIILVTQWTVPKSDRHDPDNVVFAKKFVLDALQKHGILPNDSKRYIRGFNDLVVTGNEYMTEVTLLEVD